MTAHLPANLASTAARIIPASKVLYVTEASEWGQRGYEAVERTFGASSIEAVYWSNGLPNPDLSKWEGEWIIAFKADLILNKAVLESAKRGAINFHPSPPKYRGLGGYWWALHNQDKEFGVTVHHMDEKIDHGRIIETVSFAIRKGETVESLKELAATYSLDLLDKTLMTITRGEELEPCGIEWGPGLYTAKRLAEAQHIKAQSAIQAIYAEIGGLGVFQVRPDSKVEAENLASSHTRLG